MFNPTELELIKGAVRHFAGSAEVSINEDDEDGLLTFEVAYDPSETGYASADGEDSFVVTVRVDDDAVEVEADGGPQEQPDFACVVFAWYLMDLEVPQPNSEQGLLLLNRLAAIANDYSQYAGINLLLTMPPTHAVAATIGHHALVAEMSIVRTALNERIIGIVLDRLNAFATRFVKEIADRVDEAHVSH